MADFIEAYEQKLRNNDFNFKWAIFPVPFYPDRGFTFKSEADFTSVVFDYFYFENVIFEEEAKFVNATFNKGATFRDVEFRGPTNFVRAEFAQEANFVGSKFMSSVTFIAAIFSDEATFTTVTFSSDAIFSGRFKDSVQFSSNRGVNAFNPLAVIAFDWSRTDKPELVSFHNIVLRPWWFINSNPQKFRLINVTWQNEIRDEIKLARTQYHQGVHRLLAAAYRDLSINCEENHRYREASDFRYASMDTVRYGDCKGFAFWKLHWWYWAASGYGERIARACLCFAAIGLLFALVYTKVGFSRSEPAAQNIATATAAPLPLQIKSAVIYSFAVMFLQKPDPKPVTPFAVLFVLIESLLGPAQLALLVLAVRRKFMR